MAIDPKVVIASSRANKSLVPVTTARYMLEVVMNEEEPDRNDKEHREAFSAEFQRALDAGFFCEQRYDSLVFEVISRELLDTAPAGDPERV